MRQRNNTYGSPHQDFKRSADIASVLLNRVVTPGEIAKIQIAVKLSRLCWSPTHLDSWMDIAGYAACGYEAEMLEREYEKGLKD